MRKVLAVVLLAVFVVGATGLLTVADTVEKYDSSAEIGEFLNSLDQDNYPGLDLDGIDTDDFEKVIVVTPEGIEDGTYEVKNEDSNGKVLVIVDPIHVTK